MKKYLQLLFVALFTTTSVSLTSCSSDDDDEQFNGDLWQGELGAPAYESDAVAYKITGSNEFGSIELTASGNYIVLPANSANYAPKAGKRSMLRTVSKESRAYYGGKQFGSYTKNADGTYNLKGFGTLGVYDNGQLVLVLVDGTQYVLDATVIPNIESNELNNRICRTWYVQKAVVNALDVYGNVVESTTITGEQLKNDYVKYVVMTKAGTFIQVDWDGMFADKGAWKWADKKKQIFDYIFEDNLETGSVQVTFNGDQATFIGEDIDYEEGYIYQEFVTCQAM